MRIKQVQINGEKMRFGKSDNLIYIKEPEDFFESPFLREIKKFFCGFSLNLNSWNTPKTNIKCVCEKGGIDFTITVKVKEKRFLYNSNITGRSGNFEILGTYKPLNNLTAEQKKLIRLFKADMQEFFMKESTTRQIAFFENNVAQNFTDDISFTYTAALDYALGLKENEKTDKEDSKCDYINYLKKKNAAIEKYIQNFKNIDFGYCSLGFDEDKEFKVIGFNRNDITDRKEINKLNFYDFLTANKLDEAIEQAVEEYDATPLFVAGFFENMEEPEMKKHLEELRKLDRQVFVIESEDNPILEKYCDKKYVMEDKK